MVGRALSERVKKQKARRSQNDKMAKAVTALLLEKSRPPGVKRKSGRRIAEEYQVNRRTMERLAKGGVSMSTFNASKQKNSAAEERRLVDWMKESADRGFPRDHAQIREAADAVQRAKHGSAFNPVSRAWVRYFLARHHDELAMHWSKPLDMQRAQALNPTNVDHWFHGLVKPYLYDNPVLPRNMYGMDEAGFPESDQGSHRVVGARGTKTQHKQGGGGKENVTALVCICADGTALRPAIIFKGKNFLKKWHRNNVSHAS